MWNRLHSTLLRPTTLSQPSSIKIQNHHRIIGQPLYPATLSLAPRSLCRVQLIAHRVTTNTSSLPLVAAREINSDRRARNRPCHSRFCSPSRLQKRRISTYNRGYRHTLPLRHQFLNDSGSIIYPLCLSKCLFLCWNTLAVFCSYKTLLLQNTLSSLNVVFMEIKSFMFLIQSEKVCLNMIHICMRG